MKFRSPSLLVVISLQLMVITPIVNTTFNKKCAFPAPPTFIQFNLFCYPNSAVLTYGCNSEDMDNSKPETIADGNGSQTFILEPDYLPPLNPRFQHHGQQQTPSWNSPLI